jgi:hypothetical protein
MDAPEGLADGWKEPFPVGGSRGFGGSRGRRKSIRYADWLVPLYEASERQIEPACPRPDLPVEG